ncbi:MAG: hypothetical protein AB8B50_21245 [Pirellulaceae bacterium]
MQDESNPAGGDAKQTLRDELPGVVNGPQEAASTVLNPGLDDQPGAHQPIEKLTTRAPIVVYLLLLFGLDFVLVPMIVNSVATGAGRAWLFLTFLLGTVCGQAAFLAMLAGFGWLRWIRGFTVGSLFACLGFFLLITGQLTQDSIGVGGLEFGYAFWSILLIPTILLISTVPYLIARFVAGWHITRRSTDPQRVQFSINDYFIVTAVVGALIYMSRVPQVVWEISSFMYWPVVASSSITFAFLGVLAFPASLVGMMIREQRRALIGQLIFTAVVCFIAAGLTIASTAAFGPAPEAVMAAIAVPLSACVTFFIGCWVLKASGYRFARAAKTVPALASAAGVTDPSLAPERSAAEAQSMAATNIGSDPSPWSEPANAEVPELGVAQQVSSDKETEQSGFWDSNRGARLCAGLIFAFAVVGSLLTYGLQLRRDALLVEINGFARSIYEEGGVVQASNYEVTLVKLPPSADDSTVAKLLRYRGIDALDLSDTQVTDACVATLRQFPKLARLNVSRSQLTPDGVAPLLDLALTELKIAGLQGSKERWCELLKNNSSIFALDISDLGLTFSELEPLFDALPSQLAIRGCQLTDAELIRLLEPSRLGSYLSLDVGDNELDGSCLSAKELAGFSLEELRLQGNPLLDAELQKAATSGVAINNLYLGDDSLTDAAIPDVLALCSYGLHLENGTISESGVASSKLAGLQTLALNGTDFSGLGFEDAIARGLTVLLRGSGVKDSDLAEVLSAAWVSLDLSDTSVTDAALDALTGSSMIFDVDLSRTDVTAGGLSDSDWRNVKVLKIAWGQFTSEELKRIRKLTPAQLEGDDLF